MLFRKNILPKNIADAAVTSFVIIIIPTVYWFELYVVLPTFFEEWGFWYTFHFVLGTFVLMNITSNLVAIMVVDTSIKGRLLPSNMGPNSKFCAVCESTVPPRSWHCNVCKICILKRDHHCLFTSCCIGHYNQRYFLMFVFYIFITTLYVSFYNTIFVYQRLEISSISSMARVIFPLAMLAFDMSTSQSFTFLYVIIVIGCAFTGVLLFFHVDLMLRGVVTHERNNKLNEYDLGKKQNMKLVLGERWYLVWLSPFVSSELPHEGIVWDTKVSVKAR